MSGPLAQAQIAAVLAAQQQLARDRQLPARIAERQRSREAFVGMGRDDALALAEQTFAIDRPLYVSPIRPGEHVDRYLNDFDAVISGPAGTSLLRSQVPLRVDDGQGGKTELSLAPVDNGDSLSPSSPAVVTRIAKQLSDGITVAGITVHLGFGGDEGPRVVGHRVFFANAGRDTDVSAEPIPAGVELAWQVRSAGSPEQQVLRFDLPFGAVLRSTLDGGAEIVQGDQTLLSVPPAYARDADGVLVPSSYGVSGDEVTVNFAHRSRDVKYPLEVDPSLQARYGANGSGNGQWPGWTFGQSNGTGPVAGSWLNPGLQIQIVPWWDNRQGASWFAGAFAEEYLVAPGGNLASNVSQPPPGAAWIWRADFQGMAHTSTWTWTSIDTGIYWCPNGNSQSCAPETGSNGSTAAWFTDGSQPPAGTGTAVATEPQSYSGQAREFCTGWTGQTSPNCAATVGGKPTAHPGNVLVAGLVVNSQGLAGDQFTETGDWTGVSVNFEDDTAPTNPTISGIPSPPAWAAYGPSAVHATATDAGLGMFQITAYPGNGQPQVTSSVQPNCYDPNHYQPCPSSFTGQFDFSGLPEGLYSNVSFTAADIVNNVTQPPVNGGELLIDRSGPVVTPSGPLNDVNGQSVSSGTFSLTVNATDGNANGGASAERSGVGSIQILDNGTQVASASQGCAGPSYSCPWPSPGYQGYSFNASTAKQGKHVITIKVSDLVSPTPNTTTKTITVWVVPTGPGVTAGSDSLGLEKYMQYHSTPTGVGTIAHVNQATGNLVWQLPLVDNPGRGQSTKLSAFYNDESRVDAGIDPYAPLGDGVSLAGPGFLRLDDHLDLTHVVPTDTTPARIGMTDGDGTYHVFLDNSDGPSGQGSGTYLAPPGVFLNLRRYTQHNAASQDAFLHTWAATSPDGASEFFDGFGYPSYVVDRNNNVIRLDYQLAGVGGAATGAAACTVTIAGTAPVGPCYERLTQIDDPVGVQDGAPNVALAAGRSVAISYQAPTPPATNACAVAAGAAQTPCALYAPDPISSITDHLRNPVNPPAGPGRQTTFAYSQVTSVDGSMWTGATDYLTKVTQDANSADNLARTITLDYSPKSSTQTNPALPNYYLPHVLNTLDVQGQPTPTSDQSSDSYSRMTKVTDPKGQATTLSYAGSAQSACPSAGTAYAATSPVATTNRVATMVYRAQQSAPGPPTAQYCYVPDPSTPTGTYIDADNRSTSLVFDSTNRPTSVTDPRNSVTQLAWTGDNLLSKITRAAGAPEQAATTLSYDHDGDLVSRTVNGHTTQLAYQYSAGTMTADSGLDGGGQFVADLTSRTTPNGQVAGNNPSDFTTSFAVDASGNVTSVADSYGTVKINYLAGSGGEISDVTDRVGNKTTYKTYDPSGLPTERDDPRGGHWLYGYDGVGNPLASTDPRYTGSAPDCSTNPPGTPYTTCFVYDTLDRKRSQTIPKLSVATDGQPAQWITRSWAHDPNDNLTGYTDGNAKTWTSSYTADDQLAESDSPPVPHDAGSTAAVERTRYSYDPEHNLTERDSPRSGVLTKYVYDGANDLTVQDRLAAGSSDNGGKDLITSYAYDLRGERTALADPKANAALQGNSSADWSTAATNATTAAKQRYAWAYDQAGNVTAQTENPSGLALTTRYAYDANDNRLTTTDPVGGVTVTGYDHDDRLVLSSDPLNNTTVYVRRADGLVTDVVKPNGVNATRNGTTVTYSPLTKITTDGTSQPNNAIYAYGTHYIYDANDALSSRTLPQTSSKTDYPAGQGTVTYTRDAVENPIAISDGRSDRLPSGQTHAINNDFYDTGDLLRTNRPSWWSYTPGGDGHGGPQIAENPSQGTPAGQSQPGLPSTGQQSLFGTRAGSSQSGPALPSAGVQGNFGTVSRESPPNLLPRAGQTTLVYDNDLHLTQVQYPPLTDANNNQLTATATLTYTDAGRLSALRQPFTLYRNDISDSAAGDPNYVIHELYHDPDGNMIRATDGQRHLQGDANETTYGYDSFDRLTAVNAPGNNAASTETMLYSYDPNGNPTAIQTPRGASFTWTMAYDAADRLCQRSDPAGDTTFFNYDANGNLTSATRPNSPNGACDFTPTGQNAGAPYTTTYAYDAANELNTMTSGTGDITSYSYDGDGNQTEIKGPGAPNAPGQANAARTIDTTYDGRDLPLAQTTGAPNAPSGSGDIRRTTITEYDQSGDLVRTVNPAGNNGSTPNNAYDPAGGMSATSTANWNATVREYNADGTLRAIDLPYDDNDPSAKNRWRESFGEDPRGRISEVFQPFDWGPVSDWLNGAPSGRFSTQYAYDDTDWVYTGTETGSSSSGHHNATATYAYDHRGNQLTWAWQPVTHVTPTREIDRTYFPDGSLRTRTAIDDTNSTTWSYSYAYDANQSVTQIASTDPGRANQTPDDQETRATKVGYDQAERPSWVAEPWAANMGQPADTAYNYDKDGNVTLLLTDGAVVANPPTGTAYPPSSYSAGKETSYTYDTLDREIEMDVCLGGYASPIANCPGQQPVQTTKRSYYGTNDLATLIQPNKQVETRYYNSDGRRAGYSRTLPGSHGANNCIDTTPGCQQTYNYDTNGNRSTDERGSETYNARDQLVSWTPNSYVNYPGGGTVNYTLNGAGTILSKRDNNGTTTYNYDGTLLSSAVHPQGPPPNKSPATSAVYCYDPDNAWLNSVRTAQSTTLRQCTDTLSQTTDTSYTYDAFDRLTELQGPDAAPPSGSSGATIDAKYTYDGIDRRDSRAEIGGNNTTTYYTYVGLTQNLTRERYANGNTPRQYDTSSDGETIGQWAPPASTPTGTAAYRSYGKDANGSVEGLEDPTTGAINAYGQTTNSDSVQYDPYGALQNPSYLSPDATADPIRFEGFYQDHHEASYDMQARQYKPDIARYLTPDRYLQGTSDLELQADPHLNDRYTFAAGNPLTNIENDGHYFSTGECNECRITLSQGAGPHTVVHYVPPNNEAHAPPHLTITQTEGSRSRVTSEIRYGPGGSQHVFTGHAAAQAAAQDQRATELAEQRNTAAAAIARRAAQIFCMEGEVCSPAQSNSNNQAIYNALISGTSLGSLKLERNSFDMGVGPFDPFNLVVGAATGLGVGTLVRAAVASVAGAAAEDATNEGIYVINSARGAYVGQSGNIANRLTGYVSSGRFSQGEIDAAQRIEVFGGKTAREIAEQQKIDELGGVDSLLNIRNPIGASRFDLMPQPYSRP